MLIVLKLISFDRPSNCHPNTTSQGQVKTETSINVENRMQNKDMYLCKHPGKFYNFLQNKFKWP